MSADIQPKLVDHVKTRYSANPNRILAYQAAWTPSEENNYMDDTDCSLNDQFAFRTWLQSKYVAVSTLNGIWKTNYSSFTEISPGHYPYQKDVDMQKFSQDSLHSFLKVIRDAGKLADSGFKLKAGVVSINSIGSINLGFSAGTDGTRVEILKNGVKIWPMNASWLTVNNTSSVILDTIPLRLSIL